VSAGVNALSPGWTDSDLLARGKANQKFVDSTLARTSVVVDGGYTIF
jgi:hypothetical protein